MLRLCVASHKLYIEAGRWTRSTSTPFNERKCCICKSPEDECFILECSLFNNLRKRFIAIKTIRNDQIYDQRTDNQQMLKNLALYIENPFALRNTVLYRKIIIITNTFLISLSKMKMYPELKFCTFVSTDAYIYVFRLYFELKLTTFASIYI